MPLSGAGIPQLAVVFGHCTAGGAYLPTLCDQSIMVRGTGASSSPARRW